MNLENMSSKNYLFAFVIFFTALCMESIGSYISVVGLSKLFAADWVIITMAIVLDVAKIVSVSYLYREWKLVNAFLKTYMFIAIVVLMSITSIGAYGYLSSQFQKAISGSSTNELQINQSSGLILDFSSEKTKLLEAKSKIELQIASTKSDDVRGKQRLVQSFKPEVNRINMRLDYIDKNLDELTRRKQVMEQKNIEISTEIGPILYLSKILNMPPEDISKWIILIIILVFDPLAICLILAGNSLLSSRANKINELKNDDKIIIDNNEITKIILPVDPNPKIEIDLELSEKTIKNKPKKKTVSLKSKVESDIESKNKTEYMPSVLDNITIDDKPLGHSTLSSSSILPNNYQ